MVQGGGSVELGTAAAAAAPGSQSYFLSSLRQTLIEPTKALCRPQTAAITLACHVYHPSIIHSFIQHLLSARSRAKLDIVPDLKEPWTGGGATDLKIQAKVEYSQSQMKGAGTCLFRGIRKGFKEASFGLNFYGFQQADMKPG